jgi:hypothetical protein
VIADSTQTIQYHPAWNSLPTLVWAVLLFALFLLFRGEIRSLLQLFQRRVRQGAAVKLGAFEISQAYVEPGGGAARGGAVHAERVDDGRRHEQREKYYQPNRLIMLVHRVAPSAEAGQLYDILIYVTPHPNLDASLISVTRVEYYFGKSWGRKIFTSIDRAHGFAIATSAYGPFMCTAEIHFNDGAVAMVSRYVDFEMGALGPQPEVPAKKSSAA